MISPQDLRIGNWIETYIFYSDNWESKEIPIRVKEIDIEDLKIISEGIAPTYRPIPITEEWLTKLSFEGVYKRRFKHVEDTVLTMYFQNGQFTIQDYDWFELKMPHIKSIHQVQNLYFSFSGKELQLK